VACQKGLLAKKHPELANTPKSAGTTVSRMGELESQLISVEVEREMLEAQAVAEREAIAAGLEEVPADVVQAALEKHPQIQRLQELIFEKESHFAESKAVSAPGKESPFESQFVKEIASHRRHLDELKKQLLSSVVAETRAALLNEKRAELRQLEVQLGAQSGRVNRLRQEIEQERSRSAVSSPAVVQLEAARADLARAEEIFEQIDERSQALETEINAPSRATVLRAATPPKTAVQSVPIRLLSLAGLSGMLLPLSIAVLWQQKSRRVSGLEQLNICSDLKIVGEITRLGLSERNPFAIATKGVLDHRRLFDESMDAIATRLMLSAEHQELQVLSVTSAVSGEGKTHLAANLAASLARITGEPCLLIDADLRSPSLHQMLGMKVDHGLCQVLGDLVKTVDAVGSTSLSNLHFMPAGTLSTHPHALFSSRRFAALLEELRSSYRFIVIDTAPVLVASEALVAARASDGTIISVMRDVSRISQIQLSHQRLVHVRVRVLGAVLTGTPRKQYERTYGNHVYETVVRSPQNSTWLPAPSDSTEMTC
jgi:polysaccharide biosynthesis transport protein